jgi:hypothetical protein
MRSSSRFCSKLWHAQLAKIARRTRSRRPDAAGSVFSRRRSSSSAVNASSNAGRASTKGRSVAAPISSTTACSTARTRPSRFAATYAAPLRERRGRLAGIGRDAPLPGWHVLRRVAGDGRGGRLRGSDRDRHLRGVRGRLRRRRLHHRKAAFRTSRAPTRPVAHRDAPTERSQPCSSITRSAPRLVGHERLDAFRAGEAAT